MSHLPIEVRVKYPRKARPGVAYLMNLDIVFDPMAAEAWPSDREEIAVRCMVSSALFSIKPPAEPVLLLHRFGGTYGGLSFILQALPEPASGELYVLFLHDGIPLGSVVLEAEIFAEAAQADSSEQIVSVQETEAAPEDSAETRSPVRIRMRYPVADPSEPVEDELPLRILVIGHFSRAAVSQDPPFLFTQRRPVSVDRANFSKVMSTLRIALEISIANPFGTVSDDRMQIRLNFQNMDDFSPEAIARQVPEGRLILAMLKLMDRLSKVLRRSEEPRQSLLNRLMEETDAKKSEFVQQRRAVLEELRRLVFRYRFPIEGGLEKSGLSIEPEAVESDTLPEDTARRPDAALLDGVLKAFGLTRKRLQAELENIFSMPMASELLGYFDSVLEDFIEMAEVKPGELRNAEHFVPIIAHLNDLLGRLLDSILHHEEFRRLESSWRGLQYMVDQIEFGPKLRLEILDASRQELAEDLESSSIIGHSRLFYHLHVAALGAIEAVPYATVITDFTFDQSPEDIRLLENLANVTAAGYCPLIAAVGSRFFGLESAEGIIQYHDLEKVFQAPDYSAWQQFRDTEASRYAGLTFPRILLRLPYGPEINPTEVIDYRESIEHHEHYLWGSAAFALGANIARSFEKYGWCHKIQGVESGGMVEALPMHRFETEGETLTKLSTEVSISDRREYELAQQGLIALCMRKGADNACFYSSFSAHRPRYYDSEASTITDNLVSKLSNLFILLRFAHGLAILNRGQAGRAAGETDLQAVFSKWISQYVASDPDPAAANLADRPLAAANVGVDKADPDGSAVRVRLYIKPRKELVGGQDLDLTLALSLQRIYSPAA
ncbi:MAG: type VI secretion system contractile sheath large subunit [Desulfobacterales bacterium]